MSITQVEEGLAHAKAQRKGLKKEDAPALRQIQLKSDHLKTASEGRTERAVEIQRKIKSEELKKRWFHIGRAMKAPRGGATMVVQRKTTTAALSSPLAKVKRIT